MALHVIFMVTDDTRFSQRELRVDDVTRCLNRKSRFARACARVSRDGTQCSAFNKALATQRAVPAEDWVLPNKPLQEAWALQEHVFCNPPQPLAPARGLLSTMRNSAQPGSTQ